MYYEIEDLMKAEDTEESTRVSDAVAIESTICSEHESQNNKS